MFEALVVLSGGQDSATCAAWAHLNFKRVEFLTFNYGQRHVKEIDCAKKIAALFGGKHTILDVPALMGNDTSGLTNKDIDLNEIDERSGLPKSFVPGRNLIFLTQAAAIAISAGISNLVTGVCQTDFSGYPDCRHETILALEKAIYLGNENLVRDEGFKIHTPLMYLTKEQTVKLAKTLPLAWEALKESWTCYEGGEKPCGVCPACELRIKGFKEAGEVDPAL
ncbi:7-cyano-7-deazaguanine synthase QueC [Candidatus Babeliales bacterium]|nr:7-cyano-7-deazaguanine synthase QueC [Candidatus Babeliales bacterium]